jgi:hypothetical protein
LFVVLHGLGKKTERQFIAKPRVFQRRGISAKEPNVVAAATAPESFNGYTLCEIARFIDVPAQFDGQMIREKLKRDHRENGHDVIGRFR